MEYCKNCGKPVEMMVQKGTGFCSGNCEGEHNASISG